MKTVEEKRKSVLAECATICPNIGDFSRVRLLGIGKIERTSEVGFDPHYDGKIWAIFAHGGGKILYFLHEDSDEAIIDFAYMLFGFSERDAVADTKAFYESLFAELKQSDLQLVEIYAQAEVGRLQAEKRDAALVAAAELVIKRNWERINGDNSDYSLFSQAIGNLWDALAANEKGGNHA